MRVVQRGRQALNPSDAFPAQGCNYWGAWFFASPTTAENAPWDPLPPRCPLREDRLFPKSCREADLGVVDALMRLDANGRNPTYSRHFLEPVAEA